MNSFIDLTTAAVNLATAVILLVVARKTRKGKKRD